MREISSANDTRKEVLLKQAAQVANEALDPTKNHLATLQLALPNEQVYFFILNSDAVIQQAKEVILRLLELKPVWLLQNAKFDFKQFKHHWGISFDDQKVHDTQLCEIIIKGSRDRESSRLKDISLRYPMPDEYRKTKTESAISNWWDGLDNDQIVYAAIDVLSLHYIAKAQRDIMQKNNLLRTRSLECRLTPRLLRVEEVGIGFDKEKLDLFISKAKVVEQEYHETFREEFGDVNLNSPKQVLEKVIEKYGVEPTKTQYNKKQGVFEVVSSADKYALLAAGLTRERGVSAYLSAKELSSKIKMAQTWLADEKGKLYVNFYQLPLFGGSDDDDKDGGTRSGRLSTSPQLQNITNFMKQFLVAPPGWRILSSDYAAIELRVIASLANEQVMKQAFIDGRSLHMEMAQEVVNFMENPGQITKKSPVYRIAKEINFGFLYGMGGPTFCTRVLRATGGEIRLNDDQGWSFRNLFFTRYPAINNWHQERKTHGILHGYTETLGGRRRYYNRQDRPLLDQEYVPFWDVYAGEWVGPSVGRTPIIYKGETRKSVNVTRADLEASWLAADWRWKNVQFNHPVQGTSADAMKEAIIETVDTFNPEYAKVFGSVHDSMDSLVREGYEEEAYWIVDEAMKNGMEKFITDVPIEVEHTVGRCWASPPEDIESHEHGLWIRPGTDIESWIQSELQQGVHYERDVPTAPVTA